MTLAGPQSNYNSDQLPVTSNKANNLTYHILPTETVASSPGQAVFVRLLDPRDCALRGLYILYTKIQILQHYGA